MIGFILGTSEGKKILKGINKYTDNIAVSTATSYGGQLINECRLKVLNTKPLNKEEMLEWLKTNNIDVLVDGSHPYAQIVSETAKECSNILNIDYVRYERPGVLENVEGDDIVRVKDYEEAIEIMRSIDGNILNTTGGNNVTKFVNADLKHRVIHRILPSPAVLTKIVDAGIKIKDIIAIQGPVTYELEKAFINQYDAKAILTKDSGIEGGVLEKLKAARKANIKIIVIEKPKVEYDIEFNDEKSLVDYLADKYNLK